MTKKKKKEGKIVKNGCAFITIELASCKPWLTSVACQIKFQFELTLKNSKMESPYPGTLIIITVIRKIIYKLYFEIFFLLLIIWFLMFFFSLQITVK